MSDLIRDSPFGQVLRFITRDHILRYPEEKDPSIYEKCLAAGIDKTNMLQRYGTLHPPSPEESEKSRTDSDNAPIPDSNSTRASSTTQFGGDEARPNGETSPSTDPEKGRDVEMIDWLPNDPDNPMNWSTRKKFYVTFEIVFLTFSVYIGSAIYTAGIISVTEEFHVSRVAATLGLTLFVAGYGLGPMVWAPMSEIPTIGRNPVYITTLLVFVLLQIPTALATNFGMLLAFRFLTGFIGSPALATGGASIADMYAPRYRAYGIGIWGIGAVCGPVLGPLVGGFAAEAEGWRWTIWELMWLSGFCFVLLFFTFPETSSNNILLRRTKRLRQITGNDRLRCAPELMAEEMTGKEIALMTLVRPFTLNFTEPMVFLLNLYIALIYGLLYVSSNPTPINPLSNTLHRSGSNPSP